MNFIIWCAKTKNCEWFRRRCRAFYLILFQLASSVLFCVTFHWTCLLSASALLNIFSTILIWFVCWWKARALRFHGTNLPTWDMTVHDTHDDMRNLPVMMFIIPLFLWLIAIARAVRWIECSQPSLSDLCFRLISKYAFSYPWRSRMGRKKWGKWIYHNSQRLTAMMGFGKLSIFLHRGRLGFPFGSYSNSHLITPIEIQMTRRHRWDFRVIETYSFRSLGGFTTSRCCRIPSLGFCFFFFHYSRRQHKLSKGIHFAWSISNLLISLKPFHW